MHESRQVPPEGSGSIAGRAIEIAIVCLSLLVVTLPFLVSLLPAGALWGADAYAFLPSGSLVVAIVVLGLATAVALRAMSAPDFKLAIPGWAGEVVLLLGAAILFWWLRSGHVLLGDGVAITSLLPDARDPHPREPAASMIHHLLYDTLRPVFASSDRPRADVVRDCIAVGSVVAGVGFVAVARRLARELARTFTAAASGTEGWIVMAAILAQGYMQVYFGYVETYAFPAVAVAVFVWLALRFLRGRGSILLPASVALLAVSLHFSMVVLGPALVVLFVAGVADGTRRFRVLRDSIIGLGVLVLLGAWLQWGPPRYDVATNLTAMLASARATPDYLWSGVHLRDFVNEHLRIGPFGIWLFLPAALAALAVRGAPRAPRAFLLVAGTTVVIACWLVPDLPLGYARDWDLFAPLGVLATVAGLGLTLAVVHGPQRRRRALLLIGLVSLFHTVPWILLNTSEVRSVERFKTLPLDRGRTATTIAYWHAQRSEYGEANEYVQSALAADPENTRAMDLMGRIAFEQGEPRRALRVYLVVTAMRPDKAEYRQQLAASVAAVGGADAALGMVDSLLAGREEHPILWLQRALMLKASGRPNDAALDSARALEIDPELAAIAPVFMRTLDASPAR